MVYLEPSQLGWRPIVASWLQTLPAHITPHLRELLDTMCAEAIDPLLEFVKRQCTEFVETSPCGRVCSMLKLLAAMMQGEMAEERNGRIVEGWMRGSFMFAVVWSIGGCIDAVSRSKFDVFVKQLFTSASSGSPVVVSDATAPVLLTTKFEVPFPDDCSVYDVVFEVWLSIYSLTFIYILFI